MFSSKELIDQAGISRATLNNYIALGVLPRPLIKRPGAQAQGPRQLGYFPESSLDRIRRIRQLKLEGCSMAEIVKRMSGTVQEAPALVPPKLDSPPPAAESLRVTIDNIAYPAYMVNPNFELVWFNAQAKQEILPGISTLPAAGEERSIFRLMAGEQLAGELLRFHVALAKTRLSPTHFAALCEGANGDVFKRLQGYYAEAAAAAPKPVIDLVVRHADANGERCYRAYASFFREGVFVVLTPENEQADSMLALLARRDEVIRRLLQKRLPVLTHLAVLVADLQSSVKICSELPPEEYFRLINEIWTAMGPIFRKYNGTYGKHVGDGMVYYFFPQPDSDYLMNALRCAQEIRREMTRISKAWQISKNWFNELYLNTGISEGQEWLGTFQSSTSVEFVVLGDSINQAARISDFARHGAIWATKALITKLPSDLREKLRFGIHHRSGDGRDVFVDSSFGMVSTLHDPVKGGAEKLKDIALLPIAEVLEIAA